MRELAPHFLHLYLGSLHSRKTSKSHSRLLTSLIPRRLSHPNRNIPSRRRQTPSYTYRPVTSVRLVYPWANVTPKQLSPTPQEAFLKRVLRRRMTGARVVYGNWMPLWCAPRSRQALTKNNICFRSNLETLPGTRLFRALESRCVTASE